MSKSAVAAAISFMFVLGMAPFVAGSANPVLSACAGVWCQVNMPGGAVTICCESGCPSQYGGSTECPDESDE